MKLFQGKKKVTGEIYSGDSMWPFKGFHTNNNIVCTFLHREIPGSFNLKLGDDGRNIDKLVGTWSGLSSIDKRIVPSNDLKFFGSRNEFFNEKCHMVTFNDGSKIGDCVC